MDKNLIEEEIRLRVNFKMNEFKDSFINHMNRHKTFIFSRSRDVSYKHMYFYEAYVEIKEILEKEIGLPTALDGEFEKRVWEKKEKLVNTLSQRLIKNGEYDWLHKKRFINDKICEFIGEN